MLTYLSVSGQGVLKIGRDDALEVLLRFKGELEERYVITAVGFFGSVASGRPQCHVMSPRWRVCANRTVDSAPCQRSAGRCVACIMWI